MEDQPIPHWRSKERMRAQRCCLLKPRGMPPGSRTENEFQVVGPPTQRLAPAMSHCVSEPSRWCCSTRINPATPWLKDRTMMGHRERLIDGDEFDALTRNGRRAHRFRSHERRIVKRKVMRARQA